MFKYIKLPGEKLRKMGVTIAVYLTTYSDSIHRHFSMSGLDSSPRILYKCHISAWLEDHEGNRIHHTKHIKRNLATARYLVKSGQVSIYSDKVSTLTCI